MRQASIYAVLEMAEIILITLYSIGGIKLLASTKSGMTGALLSTTSEPAYFLAFYYAALTAPISIYFIGTTLLLLHAQALA